MFRINADICIPTRLLYVAGREIPSNTVNHSVWTKLGPTAVSAVFDKMFVCLQVAVCEMKPMSVECACRTSTQTTIKLPFDTHPRVPHGGRKEWGWKRSKVRRRTNDAMGTPTAINCGCCWAAPPLESVASSMATSTPRTHLWSTLSVSAW